MATKDNNGGHVEENQGATSGISHTPPTVGKGKKKPRTIKERIEQKYVAPVDPYKGKEFEMFVIWYNLPPMFLRMTVKEQGNLGLHNDEVIAELIKIRNAGEFSKRFEVSEKTLTLWKKKIVDEKLDQQWDLWTRRLHKNVIGANYKYAVKNGMHPGFMDLYYKRIMGMSDKVEVVGIADMLKKMHNHRAGEHSKK